MERLNINTSKMREITSLKWGRRKVKKGRIENFPPRLVDKVKSILISKNVFH